MDIIDTIMGTHGEVARTPELDRVIALPRKPVQPSIAEDLTAWLGGVGMTLWPIQAEALEALHDHGGAFGIIGVGGGKTLISYLAPRMIGAKRPVLLAPKNLLKEKTPREFTELEKHWGPSPMRMVSYEKLSRGVSLDGDLIIADECHALKNPYSGRTRAFMDYMRENDVPVICMSGTITDRSLMDFWHLIAACLGIERMPLPAKLTEAQKWANAVDEKTEVRARPGALTLLTKGSQRLEDVREAVGRRIRETPGVVHLETVDVGASISIEVRPFQAPPKAKPVLRKIVRERIGPNGDELTPADVWRHSRTAMWGFVYVWVPAAPADWLKKRSRWKRLARCVLESFDPRYRTELAVSNAADRGELDDLTCRAWREWKAVRASFKPNSVPIWYGTEAVERVAKIQSDLFWVQYQALGEKLAEITGWPYYREKGMCGSRFVGSHDAGPAIVSIGSCSKGHNLQRFHRNVVLNIPPKGQVWEQMIGRTHRPGQQADTVEFIVLARAHDLDLIQAREDALYQQQTAGQPQKLCLADWI
jgi:hypothetical protein